MPNKKFIEELKELLRLRGKVSNAQVEYARVEEMEMMQMYPATKPSEENRFSNPISAAPKKLIKLRLQHYMNSLHIYSLVCCLNVSKEKALKTAMAYEKFVHPLLYFKKEQKKGTLTRRKTN